MSFVYIPLSDETREYLARKRKQRAPFVAIIKLLFTGFLVYLGIRFLMFLSIFT